MLHSYVADLHIHIGRDMYDRPVKITASNKLTLTAILKEASRNKGVDVVGVIDCQSPGVLEEIQGLIDLGLAHELTEGGIQFEKVTLLLGSEIEVYDEACHGPIHVLCYFPTLQTISLFSRWLCTKMKNSTLSSQRFYGTGIELQQKVKELAGIFIPAHVFTPFKSLYGKGVQQSLTEVFSPLLIDGIELGLSSDTHMADQIKELHHYTYLTNSDAHSLGKIAREYQLINMKTPSFTELLWALRKQNGRRIIKNYGLNPKLGKYYTTVCGNCYNRVSTDVESCPLCHSKKIIKGVSDRIRELCDVNGQKVSRPPYTYQVPLDYLPGLGKKTYAKLLQEFGTEMNVIHKASREELMNVIPEKLAQSIIDMRQGLLTIREGGGGRYGSVR
ncbi:MAG: endonuclease Q family protein [Virgibacillus proomii]